MWTAGEEKQTKVRIEGRRRLCKISKNNEDTGAGENIILDILDDLSSRLESLSIKKKKPEKVDIMDEFKESLESNLHDVTVKQGFHEHKAPASSHLPYIDSLDKTTKTLDGDNFINKYQKKKTYGADAAVDTYVGKPHRNTYKYEMLENNVPARVHAKSGSTKELHDHTYRREDENWDTDDYVALKKRNPVKKAGRQANLIDVSDEESDEVSILDDHVDDFTLSGLKGMYKLPGKTANMLYPHQREGLEWLWSLHCKGKGGILGDDMGLGKTMQVDKNAYVNSFFMAS